MTDTPRDARGAELVLRAAVMEEHAALEALQLRASLANPGDRAALEAHPEAATLPSEQITLGDVMVATMGPLPLGFAALARRRDGDVDLDGLFVDPDAWRFGLGSKLVQAIAARARDIGAQQMHVIANPHALAFYVAAGFVQRGRVETEFGPAVSMVRAL